MTTKEVAGAGCSGASLRLARFANIGVIPLVMAFAVILVVNMVGIIQE